MSERRAGTAGRLLVVTLPATVTRDAVLSAARLLRASPCFAAIGVSIDRTPAQQASHFALLRLRREARDAGNDAYISRERLVVVMRPLPPPIAPASAAATVGDPSLMASTSAAAPHSSAPA